MNINWYSQFNMNPIDNLYQLCVFFFLKKKKQFFKEEQEQTISLHRQCGISSKKNRHIGSFLTRGSTILFENKNRLLESRLIVILLVHFMMQ